MNNKINIKLNNIDLKVNNNYNIIQVCNKNNIDIPKFCYSEKLSIAGNCRMCLVEVKGSIKPVASCSIPVNNNMEIFTNTKMVKKAREGIIEFILLNHPLDCPICDQGGECDLQDQSLIFGSDKGRFYEYKRSVNDKNCGPLIKTLMTRCIHCTRCVRYMEEIVGINNLGIIGRGKKMEISNFLKKIITSEISGNVIDLCPVGALTSKPYSFVARPWEIISYKTIDINDIMHSNIRVDIRDANILRILPVFKENLNENLISDITRFSYDGYKNFRIIHPFIKLNNSSKFISKSWLEILSLLKLKIYNKKINYFLGNFLDAESIIILKKLSNNYGNYTINLFNNNNNLSDFRNNYIFNYKDFYNLKNYKNILLIGLNLRIDNPILNYKLKYLSDKNITKIFNIGSNFNLNYFSYNYGNNLKEFYKFINGKSYLNNIFLKKNILNLIIIGLNFINNCKLLNFNFIYFKNYLLKYINLNISIIDNNSVNILSNEFNLTNNINNFNNFSYKNKKESGEIIYILNSDNFNINYSNINNFLIYQGHNLNEYKFLNKFNVILPSVNFLEKNAFYVNFFGLIQNTNFILYPPKNSRVD
jgi:NADH-quinone oxidoreductase chain G